MARLTCLCMSLITVCLLALVSPAASQSLIGLTGGGSNDKPDISEAIEQATESGVGVIVIDTEGNVLSPVAANVDAASETAGSGASLMSAQANANAFRNALVERLVNLPEAVREIESVLRTASPDGTIFVYVWVLGMSMALFAIGMVAERYIYGPHIAGHFIKSRIRQKPEGYAEKIPFLTIRFIAGVIGTLFSMVVAYVIGFAVFGTIEDVAIQYTATLVNIGYFSARVVAGLWRMILSPYLPQYRIPRLDDAQARRLHRWLSGVAVAGVFTMLFGSWVREFGLNPEVAVFNTALLSFVVMLLNILLVIVNRKAIRTALLNGQDILTTTWPVRFLARAWVPVVLFYLLFGWAELVYDLVLGIEPGIPLISGAYLILTVVLVVYGVINYFIEKGFARARAIRSMNGDDMGTDPDAEDPAPEAVRATRTRLTTFEDLARRIAAILAFVAGGYAFLSFWEPDTGMMQDSVPARTLDIVVILFIGYIIYNAFRIWIDAKIAEELGDDEPGELGDEGGGSSASRLATLLPLFRNVVLIVIIVSLALIILMEMGVNVGPLFAGAGIVGVAVGFGSQSLVRDIFSGAFFLFDDAFRKGEYIEIGDVRGTVENISVRSFQLRHHLGKLHTIPFGEIQVLTNYSRDWVMMKLPLRVTYDTDVEKVRKLIKKLGQRLLEDPVIGEDFIQPLKSQGVIEMQDSAMIIRVKFMTKPGDQWVIRKRVFQEIRDLFETEGIRFAHREVTVRLADEPGTEITPRKQEAILAAAEATIEEDLLDDGPGGGDDR